MCTYAGIDTVETEIPRDLTDHWRGPESHFIAPGALTTAPTVECGGCRCHHMLRGGLFDRPAARQSHPLSLLRDC